MGVCEVVSTRMFTRLGSDCAAVMTMLGMVVIIDGVGSVTMSGVSKGGELH